MERRSQKLKPSNRIVSYNGLSFFLLDVLIITTICYCTLPRKFIFLYIVVVIYYYFYYTRMIDYCGWTKSTLKVLFAAINTPIENILSSFPPNRGEWPRFLVLIPAYKAGYALQIVTNIISYQSYPNELWRAIIITDQAEIESLEMDATNISNEIIVSLKRHSNPVNIPVHEAARLLYITDNYAAPSIMYISVFGLTGNRLFSAWILMLLSLAKNNCLDPALPREICKLLSDFAKFYSQQNSKIRLDLEILAGLKNRIPHDKNTDVHNSDLDIVLVKIKKALLHTFSNESHILEKSNALHDRFCNDVNLGGKIRTIFIDENPSTSKIVRDYLTSSNTTNLFHFLRPPGGQDKASALNFGFNEAERLGWLDGNTHIVVLDCDSILHTNALLLAAQEIICDSEKNVIRQLVPITTSNFANSNWFTQSVIIADSMGLGRWAKSVRTQSRADLTAGAGVIIPTPILHYLIKTYGEAWDTSIICEDARLILSQYAMFDGARKLTKMVPCYLLEAAPQESGIWLTYKAFWRQRMRWAFGGMDEVVALLKVSTTDLQVKSSDFSLSTFSMKEKVVANIRRLRLLVLWFTDHLWWGGMSLAPIFWFFAEMTSDFNVWLLRIIGLCLMFGIPLTLLKNVFFSSIIQLVPGQVKKNFLWIQSFTCLLIFSGAHIWPVTWAQMLFATGHRKSFRRWNPKTPKPRFN